MNDIHDTDDDTTGHVLTEAVAQWCEDTANEIDGDEATEAAEIVTTLLDQDSVQAATLAAAAEVWLRDGRLDASLKLDEVDVVRVVATAVSLGEVTSRTAPDPGDFLSTLVALLPTELDAADRALGLLRGWLEADGLGHYLETVPTRVDRHNLAEVRLCCVNTAPGYGWFEVDGVGWVVHRLGNV